MEYPFPGSARWGYRARLDACWHRYSCRYSTECTREKGSAREREGERVRGWWVAVRCWNESVGLWDLKLYLCICICICIGDCGTKTETETETESSSSTAGTIQVFGLSARHKPLGFRENAPFALRFCCSFCSLCWLQSPALFVRSLVVVAGCAHDLAALQFRHRRRWWWHLSINRASPASAPTTATATAALDGLRLSRGMRRDTALSSWRSRWWWWWRCWLWPWWRWACLASALAMALCFSFQSCASVAEQPAHSYAIVVGSFVRWVRSLSIDANLSLLYKRCREDVHANWDCDWNWELCVQTQGGVRYHHHQWSWAGWTPVLSLFGGLAININGLWVVSSHVCGLSFSPWFRFHTMCVVGSIQISIYIYLMLYIQIHTHTDEVVIAFLHWFSLRCTQVQLSLS